jgi:hypothetical protein
MERNDFFFFLNFSDVLIAACSFFSKNKKMIEYLINDL